MTDQHAIVGCNRCEKLQLVTNLREQETAECRFCGKTHQADNLRIRYQNGEKDVVREFLSRIRAEQQGYKEEYESMPDFGEMEPDVQEAIVSDEEILRANDLNAAVIDATVEDSVDGMGGGMNRRETVEAALETLTEPTLDEICDFCESHGVAAADAREQIEKMRMDAEIVESGGTLRLV